MAKSLLIFISLCLSVLMASSQGSTCSNAIPLAMDGNEEIFPTSTSTGDPVVCTNYSTNSPVTWFSFTTNASAECPLLFISASDSLRCEVALYTACNGGQTLQSASSMCFDDGFGLWAPAETYAMSPNQTYYLRIKTSTNCVISIGSQFHVPTNDDCAGAISLGTSPVNDNNACHQGGPGVFPDQLCAFTLENTAFYSFIVASDGSSIINIGSISCDNGSLNNSSGFQIGFFTGTCSSLNYLTCTTGSGNFVQATTPPLLAGTQVIVAIDGTSGSNCLYAIAGINVYGVLAAADFKNFSAWKKPTSNSIKWTALNDSSLYYDIERSENGSQFVAIGRINRTGNPNQEINYSFSDNNPFKKTYYRLKRMSSNGKVAYSRIIHVNRHDQPFIQLRFSNLVHNALDVEMETNMKGRLHFTVINAMGQEMLKGNFDCNEGINRFYKDLSSIPKGKYYISFSNNKTAITERFIKL